MMYSTTTTNDDDNDDIIHQEKRRGLRKNRRNLMATSQSSKLKGKDEDKEVVSDNKRMAIEDEYGNGSHSLSRSLQEPKSDTAAHQPSSLRRSQHHQQLQQQYAFKEVESPQQPQKKTVDTTMTYPEISSNNNLSGNGAGENNINSNIMTKSSITTRNMDISQYGALYAEEHDFLTNNNKGGSSAATDINHYGELYAQQHHFSSTQGNIAHQEQAEGNDNNNVSDFPFHATSLNDLKELKTAQQYLDHHQENQLLLPLDAPPFDDHIPTTNHVPSNRGIGTGSSSSSSSSATTTTTTSTSSTLPYYNQVDDVNNDNAIVDYDNDNNNDVLPENEMINNTLDDFDEEYHERLNQRVIGTFTGMPILFIILTTCYIHWKRRTKSYSDSDSDLDSY